MPERRRLPDTEKSNPRTMNIPELSTDEIVNLIHSEDISTFRAIDGTIKPISKVIDSCFKRLKMGGRVVYVGSGTSGRIGAQDAIEMWPTYGLGKETFDYVIAGGERALAKSIEGAEDSRESAIEMIEKKNITANDCVIGITASGRTPFVFGALESASKKGAYTAAIVNSRNSPLKEVARNVIFLKTGEEVIQGSTRMKAATAQKMVLNIISTSLAIKLGRTYGNQMIHMKASYNAKLRDRAVRILAQRFNISAIEAEKRLKLHKYNLSETAKELEQVKRD